MKKNMSWIAAGLVLAANPLHTQNSMLAEFKALPAFYKSAKDAYSSCKINKADNYFYYEGCSPSISTYTAQLKDHQKPYEDLLLAKGKNGEATSQGAMNEFADLNSPETQAKIAKMTQEEQLKFAMELQERMKNSQALKTLNETNKPSPATAFTTKLFSSFNILISALEIFERMSFPGYNECDNLCPTANDPACASRTKACENKVAHRFYNSETARYDAFMKRISDQFNSAKAGFEKDLAEFDKGASAYSKDLVAADYASVYGMLASLAAQLEEYEKQGASLIAEAKNNVYCSQDY